MKQRNAIFWSLLFLAAFEGCGVGLNRKGSSHTLNFIAVKGAVTGGVITVFTVNPDGTEGKVLATGTTESGLLTTTFPPVENVPIGAKISGGEYLDEATGQSISLGSFTMSVLLSEPPKTGSTVYISALTELAAQYAKSLLAAGGSISTNISTANTAVASMAGLTDIVIAPSTTADPTKTPEDPTSETAKYGLILAGLSQQADTLGVPAKSLVAALAEDIQDGRLDGAKNSQTVAVEGGSDLQNDAWTNGLTAGMDKYVNTNTNNPGFTADSKPITYPSQTVATAENHATITNVSSTTASGTLLASSSITIQVTFSEAVTVTGTPKLKLNSRGSATYASGSGTATLSFTYTVLPGENSSRLDCDTKGAFALLGGTIKDSAGVDATLVLPTLAATGSLKSNTNIVVNTVPTAPTSLTATNGDGVVPLSWTAPTGYFGTVTYNVYRGSSSNGEVLLASGVSSTSYSDTAVVNDSSYYYVVKSVAPGGISPASNEVNPSPYHPVFTSITLEVKSGSLNRIFNNGTSTTILRATTLDQRSLAYSGRVVTVAIPTNGGTITTNPVTSNGSGIADFTLTSSTTKGVYSYTASANGITSSGLSITFDPCAEDYLTNSPFATGKGSFANPYWICTAAQFNSIGTNSAYTTRYFVLAQSISLSSGVTPVGNASYPFRGSFNGQNYSLTGVSLTGAANNVGVFSYVSGGTIKNLTVAASTVSASSYNNVGVLVGYATGGVLIRNVTVTLSGALSGAQYVGGLVGNLDTSANTIITGVSVSGAGSVTGSSSYVGGFAGNFAAGNISNSNATVSVTSTYNNASAFTGGFIGSNAGTIGSSYTSGTVTNDTANAGRVGGLVGSNSGTISYRSYSSATVSASGSTSQNIGGLVGYNTGTLSQSYSTGGVTGKSAVGGLVGNHNSGTIQTSYSTSTVTGGGNNVGGLIGYSASTVNDCYATGNATSSSSSNLGGAIGNVASGTVSRIYSIGAPSGSSITNLGGLIGSNSGTLASGFWDTTTSSQSSSAAGTGLPTAGMKSIPNYVSQCWDFGTVWQKSSSTGYPILQWQTAQTPPTIASLFAGGAGTSASPYQVSTAAQLGNVAYAIQLGTGQTAHYKLTTNINLSGADAPSPIIGCSTYPFKGTFDGFSNQIQNYTVTGAIDNVGLFGYIQNATIKDLTVTASAITGGSYSNVGAVIGYATGNVALSSVTLSLSGTVTGNQSVGGFAGYLDTSATSQIQSITVTNGGSGTVSPSGDYSGGLVGKFSNGVISYSSSAVPVTTTNNSGSANDGGLVGYMVNGVIYKGSSSGAVTNSAAGPGHVGGLVGAMDNGTISASYSTGAVSASGTSSAQIGGLVGIMNNSSTINKLSYSSSSVTSGGNNVGGLVGYIFGGTVSDTYSTGTVQGNSQVGGLVGEVTNNSPVIRRSYSSSNVTGVTNVGGIIGTITGNNSTSDCYALGSVTANGGNLAGGAIGGFTSGSVNRVYSAGAVSGTSTNLSGGVAQIPNSTSQGGSWLWDTTTSGQATSAGGRGLATALMKAQSTFVNEGWDFSLVWQIPTATGYPILQWQANQTPLDITTFFAGGSGSATSPFLISNVTQLQKLAYAVQVDYGARFSYYKLTTDIDLTGQAMPVIGTSAHPFSGVFDGFDHQIQNYSVTANSDYVGLFGYVDGGTIQNLTVTVGSIDGTSFNYIGGVVGYATGITTLSKVYVDITGTIRGTQYVGGLGGFFETSQGTIVNECRVTGSGNVSGYTSGPGTSQYVGGLIGNIYYGNIEKSYATIPVSTAKNYLGGLLGKNAAYVTSSYATGAVSTTSSSASAVGGLVGSNGGTLHLKCYSTGNVTASGGSSQRVGGLVGLSDNGSINMSYATGTVNSINYVGGLVGENQSTVTQSYSNSAVTGTTRVGGIVGYNSSGTVSDSYATGTVTLNASGSDAGGSVGYLEAGTFTHVFSYGLVTGAGTTNKGGFAGTVSAANNRLNGVFWDKDTGYATSAGTSGYKSSYTGSTFGIATADLQKYSTFVAATYDFFSVWQLPTGGSQYPKFQWQLAQTPLTIETLFNAGAGTESSPYEINTAVQLQNLAYAVQLGATGQKSHYILTANIDLSGYISPIIGTSTYPFSGTFDGKGYAISNYQATAVGDNTGLFGYVSGGTIKNLTLNAVAINGQAYSSVGTVVGYANSLDMARITVALTNTVTGQDNVGGLIGKAEGNGVSVNLCSVTGSGSGAISPLGNSSGGLVGYFNGTANKVKSSYSAVPVSASGRSYVGGIVGYLNNATIQTSYSTGNVTGGSNTGGVAGLNQGYIKNSYSSSTISGSSSVGGVAGQDGNDYNPDGVISQSYSTGSVTGTSDHVGGVVGLHWNGSITDSYATGNVSGNSNVGGVTGYNRAAVTDAYAQGNITATGDRMGGAVGHMEGSTLTRVYAKGTLTGSVTYKGGFLGYRQNGSFSNCFWDSQASGNASAAGNAASLSGISGQNTAAMQDATIYTNASWNFTSKWQIPPVANYPVFQWQGVTLTSAIANLFNGGDGSSGDPYQVNTEAQLNAILTALQNSVAAQSASYKLTANITLTGASPIIGTSTYPFSGVFDGNGKSISNFTLTGSADNIGLFGYVGTGAVIKDLTLNAGAINGTGYSYVGTVVGRAVGAITLSNITVDLTGTLSGVNYVGGIIGSFVGGDMLDCVVGTSGGGSVSATGGYVGGIAGEMTSGGLLISHSSLPVTSTYSSGSAHIGGAVGYCGGGSNYGAIVATYSTGAVTNNANAAGAIGGFVGSNYDCIISQQSHSTGTVTASGSAPVDIGGLVGNIHSGSINFSYSTSTVTATNGTRVGGLVGYVSGGSVNQSYASGAVTGSTEVGGLVGNVNSNITDAYATGLVTSAGNKAGGAFGNVSGGTVSYVYSTGNVAGGGTNQGGLAGAATPTTYGCNWDTGTSAATSATGLGQSTADMKLQKTFVNQGWNFGTTWVLATGPSYPVFQWQQTSAPTAIASLFAAGSGTPASPFQINTAAQLQNLALAIQQSTIAQTASYVLTANINVNATTKPIIGSAAYPFKGDFNGQGYAITNYSLTGNNDYQALFGYIEKATVRNFSMTVSTISATAYNYIGTVVGYALNSNIRDVTVSLSGAITGREAVGGLIGKNENDSTIATSTKHCSVTDTSSGSVAGTERYVGGLIGLFSGGRNTLDETYSTIAVSSSRTGSVCVGGLVGENSATINKSYSTGAVSDSTAGATSVGGLVGYNSGTITGISYSSSTVTTSNSNSEYTGGLVGLNSGSIYKSYASGAVTGYQRVGGVSGYNSGTLDQTYSTSTIAGTLRIGGLAGENAGTVNDSYARGAVTGNSGNYVGGAVGLYSGGSLNRFYATGAVSGTSATNMGGLVGANTTSGPTFGGVWDSDTSGISSNTGTGCSVPNYCGVPYSDTYMKQKITFTNNGWNFYTTWVMPTGAAAYPILQWQQPITPTELGNLFAGGDGTSSSPFQITTAAQLENFAYAVTTGTTGQYAHYTLTTDINLSGLQMPVIGTAAAPFSGFFDGANHTISNYAVTATEHYSGLFGYVSNATIQNLTLNVSSLDAASYNYIGAIVGYATGSTLISNVTVNLAGDLKGDQYVGGFAGHLDLSSTGLVKNCHVINSASGTVAGNYYIGGFAGKLTTGHITYSDAGVPASSTTNTNVYLGGFVGLNTSGYISHSYSTGTVTDNTNSAGRIGGLVGENTGTINGRSYSTSTVSATGTSQYVGGLVGVNSGTVNTAYATGNISAYDYAGGLLGYTSGTVSEVYASGTVSGHNYTGGIAGQMANGTLTDSYATGAVSNSSGSDTGGAIGNFGGGTAQRIYSTGAVSGSGNLGGLVGNGSGGYVYNSLWDTTTSGQATSARGNGFATAIMQMTPVYTSRHWNFRTIWNYVSGSSYPTLQWQQQQTIPSLASLFDAGDGTKTSPFQIATAAQLGNMPYAMQAYTDARTAYYVLTANINLSGAVSPVIGTNDGSVSYPFMGFFDGQDYTISNYSITTNADYVGLFGYVDGATIQNFDLTVTSITGTAAGSNTGTSYVGGLIGYATGILYVYDVNITHSGTVSGYSNIGGFAGKLDVSAHSIVDSCSVANGGSGAISATRDYIGGFTGSLAAGLIVNSSNAISVTSTYSNASVYVGGLVGSNSGTISNSYNTGSTTDNQNTANYVGGLVGNNSGTINTQSYSTGTVSASASGSNYTGGLAGLNGGTITQSYATGSVTGYHYVGGIVGHQNGGSLTESYATGAVTGTGSYAGGIAGIANTAISDCYARGAVSSSGGNYAGGAIGFINNGVTVSRVYSTGAVSGSSGNKGGLVGDYSGSGTVTNGFWDTTTSGNGSSALGTGNNTTAMQTASTFTGASWDVDSSVVPNGTPNPNYKWKFSAASGVYPSLGWQ